MVLQHAVKYHEARDWIRQQDQSQLTYQALLSYCKMLEACCEQYQKAKERGHTDLASKPLQHHLCIWMPCPNHQAAISVGTPIQLLNVQPKVCNVLHAMVLIILLFCAKRRDAGNPGKSNRQALSPASTIPAMDIIPVAPHVGTAAEAIVHAVIPGPLPTALHVVLPMAHPLGAPHIPKGVQHPTGTTRTL